jgi:hypothetical protein
MESRQSADWQQIVCVESALRDYRSVRAQLDTFTLFFPDGFLADKMVRQDSNDEPAFSSLHGIRREELRTARMPRMKKGTGNP